MRKQKAHRKGFTWIEGAAATAILGILALVAIPKYVQYNREANKINHTPTAIYSVEGLNGDGDDDLLVDEAFQYFLAEVAKTLSGKLLSSDLLAVDGGKD